MLAAALWTLVGAWGISSLWYPFGWDQGIFAWVGDTILRGGMPYRDAFDLKGPAAHLVYAAAQAVFGHNQWGVRVVDLGMIAGAAWVLGRFVGRSTDRDSGRFAAAVLILWYGGLTFWHTAQPDGFAASALCLGFVPLLHEEGRSRRAAWIGAGLAVGFATAIKPTYAAFLLVPALLAFVHGRPTRAATRFLAAALAAAVVVGAFVTWFAMTGALGALMEVHLRYNAATYSSGGALAVGPRLEGLFAYVLGGSVFVIALPAALVGAWTMYHRDRPAALAVVVWAGLAVGTVVLQNKFFDYQWAPLFAPVVILGAIGLHTALRGHPESAQPSGSAPRRLSLALFCVLLFHASLHPAFEVFNWATYVVGVRDRVEYYDTFGVPGNDLRMSEYLRSQAAAGDRLFVMAWNVEILYTSGLEPETRFGYSLPFWMGDGSEAQARYRGEVMDELLGRPPEFIVVGTQAVPLVGRTAELEEFPEFVRFLRAQYTPDVIYGDLQLFRLR